MVEEKGFGDTFDVSWSLDGKLLSACFASGIVNVMNVDNLLASSTTGDAAGSIRIGSELESNVPMEPVEDSIVAKMQEGVSADVVVPAEKLDDMNVEENAEKGDTGALEPLVEPLVTNESDAEPEPEPAMEEA